MRTSVPASFEALFGGSNDGDRVAVEQLCRLVDAGSEVTLDVDGRRVALPASIRTLLQRAVEHLRRGDDIRRSLGAVPVTTLLQPVVDLASGAVVGYEALSDLNLRPNQDAQTWFRDAAVLGLHDDDGVLLVALALRELDRLPKHTYLSINLSPVTLLSPHLLELLRDVDTNRLVFEITEHLPVADYGVLDVPVRQLRERGVRVAVDDAGAGFASLQHILSLRPEIVKLDASLIRGIETDEARHSLIAGLRTFIADIPADCVAEGVETHSQAAILRKLGISHGQGWYLGPPRRGWAS